MEEVEEHETAPHAKYNRSFIWVLQYLAMYSEPTAELFREHGMEVAECHSMKWKQYWVCLIRLKTRQRKDVVEDVIRTICEECDEEIEGDIEIDAESFSRPLVKGDTNDMHQHAGFLSLMRLCRSRFSTWTENGEGGLLEDYIDNNKDSDGDKEEEQDDNESDEKPPAGLTEEELMEWKLQRALAKVKAEMVELRERQNVAEVKLFPGQMVEIAEEETLVMNAIETFAGGAEELAALIERAKKAAYELKRRLRWTLEQVYPKSAHEHEDFTEGTNKILRQQLERDIKRGEDEEKERQYRAELRERVTKILAKNPFVQEMKRRKLNREGEFALTPEEQAHRDTIDGYKRILRGEEPGASLEVQLEFAKGEIEDLKKELAFNEDTMNVSYYEEGVDIVENYRLKLEAELAEVKGENAGLKDENAGLKEALRALQQQPAV